MTDIIFELLDCLPFLALLGFVWAPKTWTPGELVSAAAMNTNIRDHLNESVRKQDTALTGTQNNLALDGPLEYLKCANASALTLTGALIDSGNVNGAKVIVEAISYDVILNHENAGSTTSNRFRTPDSGDLTLSQFERALLIYDGTTERWRVSRVGVPDDHYQKGVHAYNDANLSIPNAAWTTLTFNQEYYDPSGMHSTVANTNRILTGPKEARYLLGAQVSFDTNNVGVRGLVVRRSDGFIIARSMATPVTGMHTALNICIPRQVGVNKVFEVQAYQSSGGALNILVLADYSPNFWAQKVDGPHTY